VAGISRGFRAFNHPNFRLYLAGQAVSQPGTWMQSVAQAWLVLKLTNSPIDLGIVLALQGLPVLVIGVFGGVFADRLPKRRLMVITQVAEMLLAFALGILVSTHVVQIWHVYALAFALGVAMAVEGPTRQSFMMEMVGRDDLMSGIAVYSSLFNTSRVVGPALAGLLISWVGVTSSFYINGISFIFVIAALLMLRADKFYAIDTTKGTSVLRSLGDGLLYVRRTSGALVIVGLVGVMALSSRTADVLVPVFAKNILEVGALGLGILLAAQGAGSVTAGISAAISQKARWSWIITGSIGIGLAAIGFAMSRSFLLSIALMYFMGLCFHIFWTTSLTGIQQRTPDRLRGRVMGVYMTMASGPAPIGNLAAGAIAATWGAPIAMAAGGLASVVGASSIVAWMFLHRRTADLRLTPDDEDLTPAADRMAVPPRALDRHGDVADEGSVVLARPFSG
jgi:MFS family permease